MTAAQPRLTVIVGQRDRFSGTGPCLEALLADRGEPFRLVCVDAGAPPAARAELERAALAAGGTVLAPRLDLAAAIAAAGTPYVLLLDNDAVLETGGIAAMLEHAEAGDVVLPVRTQPAGAAAPTEAERVAGPRCLLARTDLLRRVVPPDPQAGALLARAAANLALRAAGARAAVARAARLVTAAEDGYRVSDLPAFRRYWDPDGVARGLAAMRARAGMEREPAPYAALRALAERRFAAVVPVLPGFAGAAAAAPMRAAESVQGGARLLLRASKHGYAHDAIRRIGEAHELAMRLFDGLYRASGRPFLNHAVGTAGVLVRFRVRPEIVVAALLQGALADAAASGDETDRTIAEAAGDDVAARIRAQRAWHADRAGFLAAHPDPAELPAAAAGTILAAAAAMIDEIIHCEPGERPDATRPAPVAYFAAVAAAVGIPGLGATLGGLADAPPPPAFLRAARSGTFRVRAALPADDRAAVQRAYPIAGASPQAQADIAVVMPTVMRPSLLRAVRSVFSQSFAGTVQLLIGADRRDGGLAADQLHALLERRPARVGALVLDPGYSTAVRNGGVHPGRGGGAMRTILSFLANAPLVAYLDDDSWFLDGHLADMAAAVDGFDWAYSLRWFADGEDGRLLCRDRWESVGPAKGMYAKISGGLIDTNCFIVDKRRVAEPLVAWATGTTEDGAGQDRQFMQALARRHAVGWTGRHSVAYTIRRGSRLWRLAADPAYHDRLAWAAWRGWTYAETFLRWPDLLRLASHHAREKTAAGVSRDRPP